MGKVRSVAGFVHHVIPHLQSRVSVPSFDFPQRLSSSAHGLASSWRSSVGYKTFSARPTFARHHELSKRLWPYTSRRGVLRLLEHLLFESACGRNTTFKSLLGLVRALNCSLENLKGTWYELLNVAWKGLAASLVELLFA